MAARKGGGAKPAAKNHMVKQHTAALDAAKAAANKAHAKASGARAKADAAQAKVDLTRANIQAMGHRIVYDFKTGTEKILPLD